MAGHYLFLVPPNAHSVYSEHLPADADTGLRPIQQLQKHLRATDFFGRVIYPRKELLKAKEDRLVSSPTDSHWNSFGAFVAYERLAREIRKVSSLRMLSKGNIEFSERVITGDLGNKFNPREEGLQ